MHFLDTIILDLFFPWLLNPVWKFLIKYDFA